MEEANIGGAVVIIVHGVGVAPRLVQHNTFAAGLVPAILGAPLCNVNEVAGSAAVASWALP